MRDKGNFTELIRQLENRIEKFKNAMTTGQAKPDRFEDLKGSILIASLEIIKAQYSNGANKDVVKQAILECIPAFEDSFQYVKGYGQYDEMTWLLSMAILCDIELEYFNRITAILKRDSVNDTLLSTLIRYKDSTWQTSTANVLQQHPYAKAPNLQSASEIKYYLDKVWYQGHSDAAWHDTHLNTKVNCYAGYWAWEAAALAKIRGIDDSTLKNQKYYPYDAVHW